MNKQKPTAGPWEFEISSGFPHMAKMTRPYVGTCLFNLEDAILIAEAGTVFHETRLTPRQLVDRIKDLIMDLNRAHDERAELLEALKACKAALDNEGRYQGERSQAAAIIAKATSTGK